MQSNTAHFVCRWNTSTKIHTRVRTASPTASSALTVKLALHATWDISITKNRECVQCVGSIVRNAIQWRNARNVGKGIISMRQLSIVILAMKLWSIVWFVSMGLPQLLKFSYKNIILKTVNFNYYHWLLHYYPPNQLLAPYASQATSLRVLHNASPASPTVYNVKTKHHAIYATKDMSSIQRQYSVRFAILHIVLCVLRPNNVCIARPDISGIISVTGNFLPVKGVEMDV